MNSTSITKSNAAYFLHFNADFAAILGLHDRQLKWTFHAKEVYDIGFADVLEDNPYVVHLQTLMESGKGKLD